jgi:hypothetical protein
MVKEVVHVYSWFDPPPCPGEQNSGEVVVEREGYIPPNVEIMELIKAGEELDIQRGEYEFKSDEEVPDNYIDPFRSPDADIVDFDNAVGTLAFNMRKEIEEKKKIDNEKEAADAKAAADEELKKREEEISKEVEKRVKKNGIS